MLTVIMLKLFFFYITNLTLCYTNQVWKDRAKQQQHTLNSASNYKQKCINPYNVHHALGMCNNVIIFTFHSSVFYLG